MDRQSSDELATLAGRINQRGNPTEDLTKVDDMIDRIVKLHATGGTEAARQAVRDAFYDDFEDAKSLAGSVISQADGPEEKAG